MRRSFRLLFAICAVAATLAAQGGVQWPPRPKEPQPQQPNQPQPGQPQAQPAQGQAQPGQPQTVPAQTAPSQTTPAQTTAPPSNAPAALKLDSTMPFITDNVSLTDMIDQLAKQLHLKYILDKRVTGNVTIHTYGEIKPVELMPLLYTILRINQATMVQVGDLWRIVPSTAVSSLPIPPVQVTDPKTLPDDERMIMNLIFLKYSTAKEMDTLISPFLGEGATHTAYDPANLWIIQDNSRSMKRTMELVGMFDSDTFAGQRVQQFDIVNTRPSDLAKDLDNVMKAYSITEKSTVHFMPVDRINTLIAVAPNPGAFEEVKKWIEKLDVKPKVTSGSSDLWVYQLKYQRAEILAMAIEALYTGNTGALIMMSQMMNANMYSQGMGMNGSGYGAGMGMGGGGYGNGMGGGYGMGMGGGYGMGMGGGYGMGMGGGYGGMNGGYYNGYAPTTMTGSANVAAQMQSRDATGTYLGAQPGTPVQQMPHVVPNPFNNTLMIQGTAQEYEQIANLVRQLDVAPRQVLIDAKIYEVDLDNEFAAGVESFLQNVGSSAATNATGNSVNPNSGQTVLGGLSASQALTAAAGPGGIALTAGAMVSNSRQLLGLLTAQENRGKSRIISSPSIIATDGIPATMNVGSQVPVLTSQALTSGVQSGGNSVFANTVANQTTGVSLSITPRISSSGVVTMLVDQQVSAPQPPTASSQIQSPSFSNRSVSTQLTITDGDTVAIGGAILETHTESNGGVPFLNRIPLLGSIFGAKNVSTQRTELIIFLTPRVIYDSNQLLDATEELKMYMKRVGKLMKDNQ
jgi:general secretion pathway protein D